ncbi:MAG: GatB/YqeY domain-containing protein [Pseudomonadota bacterium]
MSTPKYSSNDTEIASLLTTMIKQRRDSAEMYEKGARLDLQQQELEEIAVIEQFLPKQMDSDALHAAIDTIIATIGATTMRDMGSVMAEIRNQYPGQVNMVDASRLVKQALSQ